MFVKKSEYKSLRINEDPSQVSSVDYCQRNDLIERFSQVNSEQMTGINTLMEFLFAYGTSREGVYEVYTI